MECQNYADDTEGVMVVIVGLICSIQVFFLAYSKLIGSSFRCFWVTKYKNFTEYIYQT